MTVGIIGGSGVYEALDLEGEATRYVETPFGEPSGRLTVGELAGEEVVFLPRHGRNHTLDPTEVPYRANVHALKQVGVERVLATNAVGSLREDLPPRTLVLPDQYFDRTKHRPMSFFGDGVVAHLSMAEPYCPHVREHLHSCADATDAEVVDGGTYVCIEGPQFSTRAESEFYRANDWDVIGMTTVPEANLAREAELCYAPLTGVTDYDVWREQSVTLSEVQKHAAANESAINAVLERAIRDLPDERDCDCGSALAGAVTTPPEAIPVETRKPLELLVGDYLNEAGADGL
ncbi:S-methyl-5'-thioadenosine phosphorylase [Halobacteriales archaeon QS_4_70_19]|nr:MAG: S-methyl-5'-thioadenosine phosphorylase [Halobacteriales archaeon QS_4_70_19]